MKHNQSETPAYLVWVEERPTTSRGKKMYYTAVQTAARSEIASPITTNDIEIEIAYVTDIPKDVRMDADNVIKPTLDALEGVAYLNDRQVRSVRSTIFDKNSQLKIDTRVEYIGRLFYSRKSHALLIKIYCDSRLSELGGEHEVRSRRYIQWKNEFDRMRTDIK